ncbi:MAG: methylmalonyl Co-A mutase-associated GTPase MeaB [Alicyclobacillaceae bacterium]|nr:methylmalonyl Co-A mutase-associated GTPase MeaB [Alicyclobacillaceae bacterium]
MHPLVSRILQGDVRAVAKALSVVEGESPERREVLHDLYPFAGRSHVVGLTGSPGAGKSTLVDVLLRHLRKQDLRVGVLAVDPSSPFTGGALLGDRVRMTAHSADPGVFIRSIGTRGGLGGLAASTEDMLHVLEAYGCDVILLETVGVGQSELDVLTVADTVVLVLTPGSGDSIQTAKAGIMEIADVFVVNKDDLPGSDALVREIQLMLHDKRSYREEWKPPIVRTRGAEGVGLEALVAAMEAHRDHLRESGYWEARRRRRLEADVERVLVTRFRRHFATSVRESEEWKQVWTSDERDPQKIADDLMVLFPWMTL